MLFNSYVFWAFLAVVMLVYWRLPHRAQNRFLLVASYIFYGAWDWRFLTLIWISTAVDYVVAQRVFDATTQSARKRLVAVSVITNLGILGTFKYLGFFTQEMANLLTNLGLTANLPVLSVVLPVGISFYTFQTMSYTIDVYRSKWEPCRNFLDFALYVCFFPQLVAGPIERPSHLMPQIVNPRSKRRDDFREGVYHVAIGLFKKLVIADNLAVLVETIFMTPTAQLTGVEAMLGAYAFAFQVYGDFSGYSSIAQGVAKWMGVDLMFNFRMPFFAVSPNDLWRRWHISLSTWLRDYLYIPLGGNRGGRFFIFRNLFLTMVLGGLWHGAGWTFIGWGAFHGLLLIAYRPVEGKLPELRDRTKPLWSRLLTVFVMFNMFCLALLIFRSESLTYAWQAFCLIFTDLRFTDLSLAGFGMLLFYAGPLMIYEYWVERCGDIMVLMKRSWLLRGLVYSYIVFMILFFPPPIRNAFIYFQF